MLKSSLNQERASIFVGRALKEAKIKQKFLNIVDYKKPMGQEIVKNKFQKLNQSSLDPNKHVENKNLYHDLNDSQIQRRKNDFQTVAEDQNPRDEPEILADNTDQFSQPFFKKRHTVKTGNRKKCIKNDIQKRLERIQMLKGQLEERNNGSITQFQRENMESLNNSKILNNSIQPDITCQSTVQSISTINLKNSGMLQQQKKWPHPHKFLQRNSQIHELRKQIGDISFDQNQENILNKANKVIREHF